MKMSWDEAVSTIKGRGDDGTLISGMEKMLDLWNEHCQEGLDTDDNFFDHWVYEVNAYNVVFKGMNELLGDGK
tara:strand:- start:13 stop:231 length:219 start_codon:yes stop_codon:yes gene_type:complete